MPLTVVVVLALALGALAVVLDGGAQDGAARAPLRPASVGAIVARVERERGLRFEHAPRPRVVGPAQARREGVAALDTDYPPARRRADALMLGMLGLIPPGTDLGAAVASTFEESVAGYYDPRAGRLRIVRGAQTGNRVLYEMTLAHELDHALEDQVFGLDDGRLAGGGDGALAYTALVEGSATALMQRYVGGRFGAEELLGGFAASAFQDTGSLPPFLTAQLVFPYVSGERFVARLLALGGGGWRVVDAALRFHPPASTEQVLHPDKYVAVEQPVAVAPAAPLRALGAGWRPLRAGTFGEWQTLKLLARAGGTAAAGAAAGWGGDRYALLERGGEHALVMRWRWDTSADADEFATALRAWGKEGLPGSTAAGTGAWRTPGGAAAMSRARDGGVTLVLAPRLGLARRAARAAGTSLARPGR